MRVVVVVLRAGLGCDSEPETLPVADCVYNHKYPLPNREGLSFAGFAIRGAITAMTDERALLTIAVIALVLLSLLLVGLVVVWTSR